MSTIPRFTNNRDVVRIQGYQYGRRFFLYGGNDYLSVHADASTINAGLGNDTVYLIGAYNQIAMHDGNDLFELSAGNDNYINLGGGNDWAVIKGARNTIDGGSGKDTVRIAGSNNTLYFGQDSDSIIVTGDNNTLWDNPAAQRDSNILIQGNGNQINKSWGNRITINHSGVPGWNETIINGPGENQIHINTVSIPQSTRGNFTHATSVKAFGDNNDLHVNMREGRKVNLVAIGLWVDINLDFGTAGSDGYFDPFVLSLEVYSKSTVSLNIKAPTAALKQWLNNDNNDLRYLLGTVGATMNNPNGYINLARMDGSLEINLNNERLYSFSENTTNR